MSTNINTNQVNDAINNELEFDMIHSLSNNNVQDPLTIVNIRIRFGKKSRQTLNSGLTCLWDSGYTYSMLNHNNINT